MLDIMKRLIGRITTADETPGRQNPEHDLRLATCALFLEMARIDDSFTAREQETVLGILNTRYGLAREDADALLEAANGELEESVDYWQFARVINENYSMEEKTVIIETLWRIVYVDGKLDKYEDYLMHKLANLLRLSHKQLIDAKLKVLYSK